jgi:hypothetical protein
MAGRLVRLAAERRLHARDPLMQYRKPVGGLCSLLLA